MQKKPLFLESYHHLHLMQNFNYYEINYEKYIVIKYTNYLI